MEGRILIEEYLIESTDIEKSTSRLIIQTRDKRVSHVSVSRRKYNPVPRGN